MLDLKLLEVGIWKQGEIAPLRATTRRRLIRWLGKYGYPYHGQKEKLIEFITRIVGLEVAMWHPNRTDDTFCVNDGSDCWSTIPAGAVTCLVDDASMFVLGNKITICGYDGSGNAVSHTDYITGIVGNQIYWNTPTATEIPTSAQVLLPTSGDVDELTVFYDGTLLQSDVTAGDTSVDVVDPTLFAMGDEITLERTEDLGLLWALGSQLTYRVVSETRTIDSVVGNTVSFTDPLLYSFPSAGTLGVTSQTMANVNYTASNAMVGFSGQQAWHAGYSYVGGESMVVCEGEGNTVVYDDDDLLNCYFVSLEIPECHPYKRFVIKFVYNLLRDLGETYVAFLHTDYRTMRRDSAPVGWDTRWGFF